MSVSENDNDKTITNIPIKEEINDNLISMEKLDPGSPETWPEKIPGVNEFAKLNSISNREEVPSWTQGLSQEDINSMHQLGALSQAGLIAEIKKLYDQAYQLGVEEAREMTRGKYLNIFSQNNRKK
ncbi:protein lin-52 homolog isoform X1 [Sitodiplosis mosellana]|uniref:protein lin-52 homolog isoform X1 n=1 Tax=Sitodiplosis mosellana TaxID=263140 RepID=UPI002445327A|nr:protein lin-52 homolog isoform X1 [Sitodiplosis mosellana]